MSFGGVKTLREILNFSSRNITNNPQNINGDLVEITLKVVYQDAAHGDSKTKKWSGEGASPLRSQNVAGDGKKKLPIAP